MKLTILIMMISCLALIAHAEEAYYYCGETKVKLVEDAARAVMIAPKGRGIQTLQKMGYNVSNCINDSVSDIIEIEKSVKTSMNIMRRQISNSLPNVNVQPCYKDSAGLSLIPTGYVYVRLREEEDYKDLLKVADMYGCTDVQRNKFMPLFYTLRVKESMGLNPVDVANAMHESGMFYCCSPAFSYNPWQISYDPDVDKQWGLYNSNYENIDISVSGAWNYATGNGIVVAIIDQGIELTHRDLVENIYSKSYDATTGTSPSGIYNSENSVGHGTHCAGIVGAVRNNNIDIAGVAPDAKLMSVSVDFNSGKMEEKFADAINWAWSNGADVLSCSWGGPRSIYVDMAITEAYNKGRDNKGCVIVCAAGNTAGSVCFPANCGYRVIAVGNIKENGDIHQLSSHGNELLVCAPGTSILSTMVGNTTAEKTGTSMACPHVAGVAALILERNPTLTAMKVREIISKNTKKVGSKPYSQIKEYGTWNERYGYGLVDAWKAVANTPLQK